MKQAISAYIDGKLLGFLLLVLISGLAFSLADPSGITFIILSTFLWNALIFKNKLITLYLAFLFLDNYSLVWGGDWGFFELPVNAIDVSMTQASNIIGILLVGLSLLRGLKLSRITAVDIWITIFFLVAISSPLTAADPEEPLRQLPRFVQFYILYFLTRQMIRTEEGMTLYFKYILSTFILLFIVIFLQYNAGYFGSGYEAGASGILVHFIPYLLALTALKVRKKWVVWISIFMSMFLATFQGSRRTLIAMAGYFGLHYKIRSSLLIGIGILLLAGPLLTELLPKTTAFRIEKTFEDLNKISRGNYTDADLDRLGNKRWYLWLATLEMWRDNPLFGIGLKNQTKFMDEYGGSDKEARTHNFYLEILADLGIIGFLVLLILLYHVFKSLNKAIKSKQVLSSPFLAIMTTAFMYHLIIAHIIATLGSSMLYNKSTWVLYALVGNLAGITKYRKTKAYSENRSPRKGFDQVTAI